jgi:transposase
MSTNNITIGIDLGDRRHAVCVLSAAGDIIVETEVTNTRECLTVFAQRYPKATFAMETGTHSPWISRLLESLGHRVYVANARKLRAISTSPTKNDREDARMPGSPGQSMAVGIGAF